MSFTPRIYVYTYMYICILYTYIHGVKDIPIAIFGKTSFGIIFFATVFLKLRKSMILSIFLLSNKQTKQGGVGKGKINLEI